MSLNAYVGYLLASRNIAAQLNARLDTIAESLIATEHSQRHAAVS